MENQTNTSGGASVGGNVSTTGGDFVGRDKIVIELSSFLSNALAGRLLAELEARTPGFNQNYFEQFIQPVWLTFNTIHEDYKISFREYIHKLSQENIDIYGIGKKILEDSVFSSHLRTQLKQQVEQISRVKISGENLLRLSNFINAINEYFPTYIEFFISESTPLQHKQQIQKLVISMNNFGRSSYRNARAVILHELSRGAIDSNEAKENILFCFQELQISYSKVAESYSKLKKSLIES